MISCELCKRKFTNQHGLTNHNSRNKIAKEKGRMTCIERIENKKRTREQDAEIEGLTRSELRAVVSDQSQHNANHNELMMKMDTLFEENKKYRCELEESREDTKCLIQKVGELKEMMVDLQNNPKLLVVCNKLYPLEELDLKEPKFGPVLEILDKELPEYANLGNDKTGRIHAKAINKLNHIQPTAIKNGEDVYFKSEDILSKDVGHKTTTAFIDAIGKMGYNYAQKAITDLQSNRPSDSHFKYATHSDCVMVQKRMTPLSCGK